MDYIDSLNWRYATKKFDRNKSVSPEIRERLLEAARLTASSLGLQAVKIISIASQDKREALLSHCFNQRQVVDASDVLVICVNKEINASMIDNHMKLIAQTRNQHIADLDGFKNMISGYVNSFKESGSMQNWLAKQAYITLGTLLTACALEKVDSCPMEGFKPEEVSQVLNLDQMGLSPVLILPIGYRSEEDNNQHLQKVRKPMGDYSLTI